MTEKKQRPVYERVAYEIAVQIKSGHYQEQDKIKGRSLASTSFNVSTETMRKALNLLQDYGVILIKEQSGAVVVSREKAIAFLEAVKDETAMKNAFQGIKELLEQSSEMNQQLRKELTKMEKKYDINHASTPIQTFDYTLPSSHPLVGQTVKQASFYENYGVTLYGIVGHTTISSPSWDYIFQAGDILYFSGDDHRKTTVLKQLKNN